MSRNIISTIYLRYILNFHFIVFGIITLSSCSDSPEKVVENYLDYTFLESEPEKAYSLLSKEDKFYKTKDAFINWINSNDSFSEQIKEKYKAQFDYEILSTQWKGDTATVRVKLVKPAADKVLKDVVGLAMISLFSGDDDTEKKNITKEISSILKNKDLGKVEEEKEFLLVKEKKDYKIFLNFGLPSKMAQLKGKIEELHTKADEEFRKINFSEALNTLGQIKTLDAKDQKAIYKIKEINRIKENTTTLDNIISAGNLHVKPISIEIRKIKIAKDPIFGVKSKSEFSKENYIVLTYLVRNTSEEEAFFHLDEDLQNTEVEVRDNFGNSFTQYLYDPGYETVEDMTFKKMAPGETRLCAAICEAPLAKKAEKFLMKLKLFKDNKQTMDSIYISFTKDEIGKPQYISLEKED